MKKTLIKKKLYKSQNKEQTKCIEKEQLQLIAHLRNKNKKTASKLIETVLD
jgi:hypothetical protein